MKTKKAISVILSLFIVSLIEAQTIPSFSCDQSTVSPTYTFTGNMTYTLPAATTMEQMVFLSCPNTNVYDTLFGAGRHAIVNSNCRFTSNFGNSLTLYMCFVKNTGTLTILPHATGAFHVFYEPNAVVVNQSSFSVDMNPCSNILIPLYNCNDAGINVNELNSQSFSVYPNPTNDKIFISSKDFPYNKQIEIQINDLTGRLLLKQEIEKSDQNINITQIEKGIYFLRLFQNKQLITTYKIVKE